MQIMAIAYPAIQIAMVTHGGGGQHTWDVTYEEYNVFNWVRLHLSPNKTLAYL